MGKAVLIILAGMMGAGMYMVAQTNDTSHATNTVQTSYQSKLLAREIARSAHDIASRKVQQAPSYENALASINGRNHDGSVNMSGVMTGNYQGGTYEVRAQPIDGQILKINVIGEFNGIVETISSYYRVDMMVVQEPSQLTVEFDKSWAGYCSSVYLEQYIPLPPGADSSSAITGVVSDDGKWFIANPLMLFDAGHNRDGLDTTPADLVLNTGTRLNFFIGVDTDCSEEGIWHPTFDPADYDWIHRALESEGDITDMKEGKYAMIEQHNSNGQIWRIAFEDLPSFSDIQHADIKMNGYGNSWDEASQSYGGDGWTMEASGYKELKNYGWKPDFSDQVIEVTLTDLTEIES